MPIIRYFHLYVVSGLFGLAFVALKIDYLSILVIYMLIMPMFDQAWRDHNEGFTTSSYASYSWFVCIIIIVLLAGLELHSWLFVISTIFLAALPEEFFFRGYLQRILGNNYLSLLTVSVIFSLLHIITLSWTMGVLVFIPSLVYGYIYKKTGDLILVILLHGLSNIIYKLYLSESIMSYISY